MTIAEILFEIDSSSAWEGARKMSPGEFHAEITLHDSRMVHGVFGHPGDDFTVLVFEFDIVWNRELLNWDSDEWPYLFLGIQGVTTIQRGDLADSNFIDSTISGAETIDDGSGFVSSFNGISGENIFLEHTGGFWVICYSAAGNRIEFRNA